MAESDEGYALHIRGAEIRRLIEADRVALASHYGDIWESFKGAPIGEINAFGRKQSHLSVLLAESDGFPPLDGIIDQVVRCLPEYRMLHGPELWFNDGRPVPMHNDGPLYLQTGRNVALQVWVMLEACQADERGLPVLSDGSVRPSPGSRNGALVCQVSPPPGIKFADTDFIITPMGRKDYQEWCGSTCRKTIGGDSMEPGDVLVFGNGCLHGVPKAAEDGPPGFRTALVLRCLLKDSKKDERYLRWFHQLLRDDAELANMLRNNVYFQQLLAGTMSSLTGATQADPASLCKVDRNNYVELERRFAQEARKEPYEAAHYYPEEYSKYDHEVYEINSRYAWGPSFFQIQTMYSTFVPGSKRFVDVGLATPSFIIKTVPKNVDLVLVDVHEGFLLRGEEALKEHGYENIRSIHHDVLEPFDSNIKDVDAIAVNYVFHCIQGTLELDSKGRGFQHLKKLLGPQGILFGATILGTEKNHTELGKRLMKEFNANGIFCNTNDCEDDLRETLEKLFRKVEIRIVGVTALFAATDDGERDVSLEFVQEAAQEAHRDHDLLKKNSK